MADAVMTNLEDIKKVVESFEAGNRIDDSTDKTVAKITEALGNPSISLKDKEEMEERMKKAAAPSYIEEAEKALKRLASRETKDFGFDIMLVENRVEKARKTRRLGYEGEKSAERIMGELQQYIPSVNPESVYATKTARSEGRSAG